MVIDLHSNARNGAAVPIANDVAMQSCPTHFELIGMVAIVFQHGSKLASPLVCGELWLVYKPKLKARLVRLDSILSLAADNSLSGIGHGSLSLLWTLKEWGDRSPRLIRPLIFRL